jgi:hypothetical protein
MTRKEVISYLTPLFIERLENITNMYKLIGVSGDFARKHGIGRLSGAYDESPMWLQYKGANDENNAIRFECSLSNVGFDIPLDSESIDTLVFSRGGHTALYDYFKKVKYEYLRDNHPTVWDEQKFQLPRINSFLNEYEGL